MEECTFKPKIINYEGHNRTKMTTDKCMELYMKAKPAREKRDKTRNDLDFEKG